MKRPIYKKPVRRVRRYAEGGDVVKPADTSTPSETPVQPAEIYQGSGSGGGGSSGASSAVSDVASVASAVAPLVALAFLRKGGPVKRVVKKLPAKSPAKPMAKGKRR